MAEAPQKRPQRMPHEKGTEPGPYGALEVVAHRNAFYHDGSHYVMAIVLLLIGINIFLFYVVLDLYTERPAPRYFATNAQGSLLDLVPVSQPYLTNNELLTWVMEAATEAYSMDFVSYKTQLQKKREYFTDEGYTNYLKALQDSNNVSYILKDKMVVTAQPTGTPVIQQEGLLGGQYAWRIEMPMRLLYQNSAMQRSQDVLLQMTVFRRSVLEAPRGVGIGQLIMVPKGTTGKG